MGDGLGSGTKEAFGGLCVERPAIQLLQRREVDGEGDQLIVDGGQNTVLIGAKRRELREVSEDPLTSCVENVRPVLVNENTGVILTIVGVAADVRALVADEHLLIQL